MNGFLKIVLWGCLWMASAAAAQDVLPESVWENRLSATEDTVVPIEDGSPVFLVGETVLPPTEKAPQNAFVPTPVDWEQKQQTLTMQTPFGETFSVPYIEHIPYFFVTIQLLANGQALITENIRLITTPDGAHPALSRVYETKIVTPQGVYWPVERTFLKAEHNYRPASFIITPDETNDRVTLTFPDLTVLEPGLHIFQISYLVPQALIPGENADLFFLGLLGRSLPYPIERMGILISVPASTRIVGKKVLFGENNIAVEQTVETAEDDAGHIAMKITRLLPPMTDVRVDLTMEKTPEIGLPWTTRFVDFFFDTFLIWLTGLLCMGMIGYYAVEAWFLGTARMSKKTMAKVAGRLSYAPEVMRFVLYHRTDARSAGGILLSLAEKGVVELTEQPDGTIRVTRTNKRMALTATQRYVLNRLFPAKRIHAVWDAYSFQEDAGFGRVIRRQYAWEYAKAAGQELAGGWILAAVCWTGFGFLDMPVGSFAVIGILLSVSVLIGYALFMTKGPYRMFIRATYENTERHLSALLAEPASLQSAVLEKNVPVLIALDCVRRCAGCQAKKVRFPFVLKSTKETAILLTFIEKAVFNK